jgi:heterodisulfide reductase subunit C
LRRCALSVSADINSRKSYEKLKKLPGFNLIELVEARTPGDSRLEMCIQCGSCSGSCPSGKDMDNSPRKLFAMLRAGLVDEVLEANTPWYCVSCYKCYVRCPQEVKITDIMYTLKTIAISTGKFKINEAKDFSETFTGYIEKYGRSFEFGLSTRHSLKHMPLTISGTIGLGLGLMRTGRMDLTPHKIKNIGQLKKILKRAYELEAQR